MCSDTVEMIFWFALLVASLAGLSVAKDINYSITAIKTAYEVDTTLPITWKSSSCPGDTSVITLQIINDRPDVLLAPFVINTEIQLCKQSLMWSIPRFLKTSDSYKLQIIDNKSNKILATSPQAFTLINPYPASQSTLTLLEPSGSADGKEIEATCLQGETCLIRWDYPHWATSAIPKTLDITLFAREKDGSIRKVLEIGKGIPSDLKSFTWNVPGWQSLNLPAAFVAVSGSGIPIPGPGLSCYNAASGYPFILETRAQRDARAATNTRKIDYFAPGPITTGAYEVQTSAVTFLDVPRPTFAPDTTVKASASNDASSLNFKFSSVALMVFLFGLLL